MISSTVSSSGFYSLYPIIPPYLSSSKSSIQSRHDVSSLLNRTRSSLSNPDSNCFPVSHVHEDSDCLGGSLLVGRSELVFKILRDSVPERYDFNRVESLFSPRWKMREICSRAIAKQGRIIEILSNNS